MLDWSLTANNQGFNDLLKPTSQGTTMMIGIARWRMNLYGNILTSFCIVNADFMRQVLAKIQHVNWLT